MDLWDVAKLLWRRIWLALPLVLLTFSVAAYIGFTMQPDYKATGNVMLLAPTESPKVEPSAGPNTVVTVSPYNVWSLSDALKIYLGRADVKEEFQRDKLSEEWTAEVGGTQLPIITLEVVAPDAKTANATLDRLVTVLTARLAALQSPYGATGERAVTAAVLDVGQNGEITTSKVKRAVIVVVGVGLIFTAAACIWVDAVLRRRSNRAKAKAEAALPTPVSPAVALQPAAARAVGPPPWEATAHARAVAALMQAPPVARVNYDIGTAAEAEASERAERVDRVEEADRTIILPLSSDRWTANGRQQNSPEKP